MPFKLKISGVLQIFKKRKEEKIIWSTPDKNECRRGKNIWSTPDFNKCIEEEKYLVYSRLCIWSRHSALNLALWIVLLDVLIAHLGEASCLVPVGIDTI